MDNCIIDETEEVWKPVVGKETRLVTIWEDGKWKDVDVVFGAENIPPPTMEISRGGNISQVQFPPKMPRESDE